MTQIMCSTTSEPGKPACLSECDVDGTSEARKTAKNEGNLMADSYAHRWYRNRVPTMPFTERALQTLRPLPRTVEYYDRKTSRLSVRVMPTGKKTGLLREFRQDG